MNRAQNEVLLGLPERTTFLVPLPTMQRTVLGEMDGHPSEDFTRDTHNSCGMTPKPAAHVPVEQRQCTR